MSTTKSLAAALRSWRIGAVALLSLSSGLPYGLVVVAVPAWLKLEGFDIKTIGLVTLAQAPYAFKFLWSPLMDRFHPPRLGRKRGWILLAQLALLGLTAGLAFEADAPVLGLVATLSLCIAFASASQDIAIDGYTVESLRREEQGLAVGARTALYLIGALFAGKIAISLSAAIGWRMTIALPIFAYVGLMAVTLFAPEPEVAQVAPRSLRESVWEPFVGFFRQPRALEIASFVVLYKLADNLAGSLVSPFLLEQGYNQTDVGIATATIGLLASTGGTLLGGVLSLRLGLGRALWIFGFLQAISNIGYVAIAASAPGRPLMYAAIAVETATSGMGTGAFGVLLLRLTQKRFSATQFALFSSLFALGRTVSGPIAGVLADAIGWRDFFIVTIPCALPGLFMLQRFVPWGTRDIPSLEHDPATAPAGRSVSNADLAARAGLGFLGGMGVGLAVSASLAALKTMRTAAVAAKAVLAKSPGELQALHRPADNGFDPVSALATMLQPQKATDWIELAGPVVLGLLVAVAAAAYAAARRPAETEAEGAVPAVSIDG